MHYSAGLLGNTECPTTSNVRLCSPVDVPEFPRTFISHDSMISMVFDARLNRHHWHDELIHENFVFTKGYVKMKV